MNTKKEKKSSMQLCHWTQDLEQWETKMHQQITKDFVVDEKQTYKTLDCMMMWYKLEKL